MTSLSRLAIAAMSLALACNSDVFECNEDTMCVNEGIVGVCQPGGNCSFPDPACDSGYRYGDNAEQGLAGGCVPPAGTGSASATATAGVTSGMASTSMDGSSTAGVVPGTSGPSTTMGDAASSTGAGATDDTSESTGGTARANLVFVTSASMPVGSIGGLADADAVCAAHASAARLPGTYVAWLSDSATDARDRLAGARGWVRLDGRIFADTIDDIVASNIFNPVYLDENGIAQDSNVVTGTQQDGTVAVASTCLDWTSAQSEDTFRRGESHHIFADWTSQSDIICTQNARLYCFGTDQNVAVAAPSPQMGRVAFVTTGSLDGDQGRAAFDEMCADEAVAAGLGGTFLAAMATPTEAIVERFDLAGEPWVNTVGQVVIADPMDLGGGNFVLEAAIGWNANGVQGQDRAWTGAQSPSSNGTGTCNDWSQQTTGIVGSPTSVSEWLDDTIDACQFSRGAYCLQQ